MNGEEASASTPTTDTRGFASRAAIAMPPINPPPPTATTIVSTSGHSSTISRPTVPAPAMTSGCAYGEMNTASPDASSCFAVSSASS